MPAETQLVAPVRSAMSEAIPAATPAGQRAVYAAPLTADRLRRAGSAHGTLGAETILLSAAGVCAEPKRVSWVNLLFGIGSLIGIWAIVGVLADVAVDVIKGARWGWVPLAFVLAQLPVVASAWATVGAVTGQLPYGRCLALETSNMFTSLAGGDVAVFAVRVRFFQRQAYLPPIWGWVTLAWMRRREYV